MNTHLYMYIYSIYMCIYIYIYIYIYMYYNCPDCLRVEYCEFLEPIFFFHINAFVGQDKPQFLKML